MAMKRSVSQPASLCYCRQASKRVSIANGAIRCKRPKLESLQDWIARRLPNQINEPPLDEHVRLLRELVAQDLEPDPNDPGGKRLRIRDGVAAERIISTFTSTCGA